MVPIEDSNGHPLLLAAAAAKKMILIMGRLMMGGLRAFDGGRRGHLRRRGGDIAIIIRIRSASPPLPSFTAAPLCRQAAPTTSNDSIIILIAMLSMLSTIISRQ